MSTDKEREGEPVQLRRRGEEILRSIRSTWRDEGALAVAVYVSRGISWGVFNLDRFAREAAFDHREGVDTKTHLRFPTDPDPTSEQRSYLPLTPSHFKRAMRLLPISESLYTFTDLGCGKGTAQF